jgi:hypothetical protein
MADESAAARGPHPSLPPAGEGATRWPRWLRRGRMELMACLVITLGIVMMLQPFVMILYTWSFVTTLVGTVMFIVVSKFPE